jgi:V/A-type H+/Na+-transporting ATPase subunit D
MILKVTPTRITLLKLKKELVVAQRGYKLLKDKRDGLVKKFIATIRIAAETRKEVEETLHEAFASYSMASLTILPQFIETAFMLPSAKTNLSVKIQHVMSVPIPHIESTTEGSFLSYGFLNTSGDLDVAMKTFYDVLPKIIQMAELEKTAERLAEEIERTRRRVSALENTRIPNLKHTTRFIAMRLEEQARDAVVATMRVKAMLEAKA